MAFERVAGVGLSEAKETPEFRSFLSHATPRN